MPVQASTVLYTLSDQIPVALPAGVTVYTLDGAERLQARILVTCRPTQLKLLVRRGVFWPPRLGRTTTSGSDSLAAGDESLVTGAGKVPAVVFDDAEVVYGTTDVEHARQLRGGVQP